MSEDKPFGMSLFAPVSVQYNAQLQELSVTAVAHIGDDGQQHFQHIYQGEAARQLLLGVRHLLENLDVDAIAPTRRGLQ